MYCDLPIFRRCCFCCPLRPGLIVWGYIKLTAVMILIGLVSMILSDVVKSYMRNGANTLTMIFLVILSFLLILLVIDGIFNFIFLLSAHTKNTNLMQSYFGYNIFLFSVCNIAFFLVLGYFLSDMFGSSRLHIDRVLICLAVGFINAVLQFYIILLIRSEIKKLSHDCYVTFENHGGNPQCFMTVGKISMTGVLNQPKSDQTGLLREDAYDVVH